MFGQQTKFRPKKKTARKTMAKWGRTAGIAMGAAAPLFYADMVIDEMQGAGPSISDKLNAGVSATSTYFAGDLAYENMKPLVGKGIQKIGGSKVMTKVGLGKSITKFGGSALFKASKFTNIVGWTMLAAEQGKEFGDRIIAKEREHRKLTFNSHTEGFNTQKAHTMRQQSMALMNRGAMSSRSLLGQEAVYIHK